MANRTHYDVKTGVGNELIINPVSFVGNSSSSPTVFSDEILSVTRAGAGDFDVVFRHKYPTEVAVGAGVYGSTAGLHARVSAWDAAAGTLTVNTESAGGAAGTAAAWTTGVTVTSNEATVAAGRVVAVHATTQTGLFPAWVTGIAVTSDAVTLSDPGYVVSVEATTGGSTGVMQIQNTAAPAQGFVRVEYSATGVATLTFNGTDAVTEAAVVFTRTGAGQSSKKIISTGTPAPGEVAVVYAAGVATLTFAADDAVSEAAVLIDPVGAATTAAATDPSTGDTVYLFLHTRNSSYARP